MGASRVVIDVEGLQELFDLLAMQDYDLIGPTIRDDAIVYDHVRTVADLPVGWTDEQEAGSYRLKKSSSASVFDFAVGPRSWKHFLFPPVARLWQAKTKSKNIELVADKHQIEKYAFIGVRSCEIHALVVQDRVFVKGDYCDLAYKRRRESAFVVAVNCSHASANCFCASLQTGPRVTFGFDLAVTEVLSNGSHYFLVDIGSERGASIIDSIRTRPATETELHAADQVSERIQFRKVLDPTGIKELLYRNYENPHWSEIANRCVTCGNCTMVCPTCFCTTVYETTDLTGRQVERWRRWDSCFNVDFSYIHGGSIRSSPMSRYRQWMTHKLATWIDQFGSSGCVGCGRCITWCPVGIDITEESRVIRESEKKLMTQMGGLEIAKTNA